MRRSRQRSSSLRVRRLYAAGTECRPVFPFLRGKRGFPDSRFPIRPESGIGNPPFPDSAAGEWESGSRGRRAGDFLVYLDLDVAPALGPGSGSSRTERQPEESAKGEGQVPASSFRRRPHHEHSGRGGGGDAAGARTLRPVAPVCLDRGRSSWVLVGIKVGRKKDPALGSSSSA